MLVCSNKYANYNYFLQDKFEAGIVLNGNEIKSCRSGHMSINESFVFIKNNEVFLKNSYIAPYDKAFAKNKYSNDPKRDRKLLLNKSEISKLKKAKERQGYTIVPVRAYFKGSYLKIEIAIAKGKKLYDKRETLKELDIKRRNGIQY